MKSKLLLLIFCLTLFIPSVSASGTNENNNYIYINYKPKNLLLSVNLPGFKRDGYLSDKSTFSFTSDDWMTVSFSFGEPDRDGSAKACSDELGETMINFPGVEKMKDWKFNNMYFKDYRIYEFEGNTINQKNIMGCMEDSGVWIYIHISKFNYKSNDFKLFTNLLRSIKITNLDKYNKETANMTNKDKIKNTASYKNYLRGAGYFLQGDYKNAVTYLKKSFESEKKKRIFGEAEWKTLVDTLGMVYGITKDYKNAQTTFEYGLTIYKNYPNFYYNLACNYAEQNDLKNTLANLRKAYLYRNNVLPEEKLPNPMTDDSFKGYLSNDEFIKVAKKFSAK